MKLSADGQYFPKVLGILVPITVLVSMLISGYGSETETGLGANTVIVSLNVSRVTATLKENVTAVSNASVVGEIRQAFVNMGVESYCSLGKVFKITYHQSLDDLNVSISNGVLAIIRIEREAICVYDNLSNTILVQINVGNSTALNATSWDEVANHLFEVKLVKNVTGASLGRGFHVLRVTHRANFSGLDNEDAAPVANVSNSITVRILGLFRVSVTVYDADTRRTIVGASVFIDGRYVGSTDSQGRLVVPDVIEGLRRFNAAHPLYVDWEYEALVSTDNVDLGISLRKR